jgi:hypothetical protein
MTRDLRAADGLAAAIDRLIDAKIAHDQRVIGMSESVGEAKIDLRDALKRFAGMNVEEIAEP